MANRQNKKGRTKGDGRFILLFHHVLNSKAGKSLTTPELAILIRMMEIHNGENNGRIGMSSRLAADKANVSRNTAAKSLRSLVAKGFLIIKTPSRFNTNDRRATEYEITCFPPCKGKPAKNSFQSWNNQSVKKPSYQNRATIVPKESHKPKLTVVK